MNLLVYTVIICLTPLIIRGYRSYTIILPNPLLNSHIMKKLIITLLLVIFTHTAYSQMALPADFENENPGLAPLPSIIVKTNGKTMEAYVPDKHSDAVVNGLQRKFVDYFVQETDTENPTYRLCLEIERGTILASYDDDQKLASVEETYKRVKLPNAVVTSVLNEFPGWKITDDTYFYFQKNGVITKKQYRLKLEKENKIRTIVVLADGQIKE